MAYINKLTENSIVYDIQDVRMPQATSADANKVIKVNASGNYELGEGGGSGGGNVDDVKVDGVSVVTNKIANITTDSALVNAKTTGGIGYIEKEAFVSWNGDITGKTPITMGGGAFYKVSGDTTRPSVFTNMQQGDFFKGDFSALLKEDDSALGTYPLQNNIGYGIYGSLFGEVMLLVIQNAGYITEYQTTAPETGLYFVKYVTNNSAPYSSSININNTTYTWDGDVTGKTTFSASFGKNVQLVWSKISTITPESSSISLNSLYWTGSNSESFMTLQLHADGYSIVTTSDLGEDSMPMYAWIGADNTEVPIGEGSSVIFSEKGQYYFVNHSTTTVLSITANVTHNINTSYISYADGELGTDGIIQCCSKLEGQNAIAGVVEGQIYYKEGSTVTANDASSSGNTLSSITINGTGYKLGGGGTTKYYTRVDSILDAYDEIAEGRILFDVITADDCASATSWLELGFSRGTTVLATGYIKKTDSTILPVYGFYASDPRDLVFYALTPQSQIYVSPASMTVKSTPILVPNT